MRFALMIEAQQGLTYAEQLAIARRAEAGGFEAMFRSDHYSSFPGPDTDRTTDAWAVLAGLARDTTTIRLGALVSPVTFRQPGNLAKVAATVQEMSGGRLEFGLGAGWNEMEHRRHGFPFPEIRERGDMLEEQLEIVRGLFEGPHGWSFQGRHYTVEGAVFEARPDPVPPIIVGGEGSPRSIRIAARWADEFNVTSSGPDRVRDRYARLDEACRAIDRDPASIRRSAMIGVLIGRDRAEVERRQAAMLTAFGADGSSADDWFAARRSRWIHGTPDEARAKVLEFAEAGCERIMLQDFLPRDAEMIDLLAGELVGRV